MTVPPGSAESRIKPYPQDRLPASIWREWVLSTAVLLTLTFCLSYFSDALGLKSLDNTLYDRLVARLVLKPASDDIIIVAIDDVSIKETGYWPWRRAQHAALLERLSGARAVALDLVFSEPNPAYPDDDAVLAQAIRNHGRVVLPLIITHDNDKAARPIPELANSTPHFGYINIDPDPDGVIRSSSVQKQINNGDTFSHISLAMLEAGQDVKSAQNLRDKYGITPLRIAFATFSHDQAVVPYNRVLDGSIPASTFDGKYVLVGSWGSGLGDTFATPQSSAQGVIPGVEILASLLAGGMADRWIKTPERLTLALLCMIPVLISCIAFLYLSPQRAFLFALTLAGGTFAIVAILLHYSLWWVSPSAALIGTTLAYPVWSWRSQHAALRHIDGQLAVLRNERLIPPSLNIDTSKLTQHRLLPSHDQTLLERVHQLHYATDSMRIAQHQRSETLRFLSHDMRSPLNSILALTELHRHGMSPSTSNTSSTEIFDQFDYYAKKTLALVDGFVELSRAEGIQMTFQPVNLSDLIRQCCEGAWVLAQHKHIRIDTTVMPDIAWVNADASLLERAWSNLLDNALKYSPDNTTITCTVHRDGHDWILRVQDKGRGMDATQLANAFAPFVRIDEQHPGNPSGVGLGLAFVRTVVSRHGGSIEVQSEPNAGTCFTIRLRALEAPDRD